MLWMVKMLTTGRVGETHQIAQQSKYNSSFKTKVDIMYDKKS